VPLAPRTTPAALACALALTLGLAACGGGGGGGASSTAAFPSATGKATLHDLVTGLPQKLTLAPSVSRLDAGVSRFGFGLFDRGNKPVNGAQVAVYTASASQADVRGPYPARFDALAVKAQFRSRTTADDPGTATGVYTVRLPVPRGQRTIIALVRVGGRLQATTGILVNVGVPGGPPRVGQRAIRVHTPTVASVGGKVSKIDTRVPPDGMHSVDLANVLGRKPVLLVFATPALCQSRTCGPIVDEAEQLRSQYGSRMAFIHMEVYKDNQIQKGYRPQLKAWHAQSEPWVFAIDRHGRIAAELEGAASIRELRGAIEQALRS
jgi:hypothetical protein